jgi:hypothetical protein
MNREVRLKERDRALFSEAEAGNLTHRVWENVWRRLEREERAGHETSLSRLAADEWREAVKAEGDYAPFARLLRDPRLKRRLAEAEFYVLRLAGTQDGIRERLAGAGMRRAALFLETDLPPYELDGVVFTGRCDRVEIFEDGTVITDYKWGRSSSYEKRFSRLLERRNLSDFRALLAPGRDFFRYGLQLSAYALMYGEGTGTPVAGVGFLGHKDGGFAGTFAPSLFERLWPERETAFSAALTERKEEAAEAMRCAAALLKAGRYEPCYVADACRYCGIKGVCRKGELRGEFLSMDGDAEGEEGEPQGNAD